MKLLRMPQVKAMTGLSRSMIYLKIKEGDFPEQIHLGVRTVGWLEESIEEWINQKIAESSKEVNHGRK